MMRMLIGLIVIAVLTMFGPSAITAAGDDPPGGSSLMIYVAGDDPPDRS